MPVYSARRRNLILLACSAMLLLLRVGGVHLHLCFDGKEPPATLHLLDSALEDHLDGSSGQHQDEYLDDGAASVIKNSTADIDIPPIVLAVLVLWVVLPRLRIPHTRRDLLPAFLDPKFLLPPLRGPPVTTLA
jgi:hypothetical protein